MVEKIPQYIFEIKVKNILKEHKHVDRTGLCKMLNLPRTTVYDKLLPMVLSGEVKKNPVYTKRRGRPRIVYSLEEGNGGYYREVND